jgi:hypothetical protein
MDVLFTCPSCKQQLEADSSLSGTSINCPACTASIVIPDPDPANVKASSNVLKEDKHFVVPTTAAPVQSLIEKPLPPLEVAARDSAPALRVKCIRRIDCVEVGKDHFDEVVTKFLQKIGETNVVSINSINYSHVELGSKALLNDYGVLIVYRG